MAQKRIHMESEKKIWGIIVCGFCMSVSGAAQEGVR